jgi:hypothetical protein
MFRGKLLPTLFLALLPCIFPFASRVDAQDPIRVQTNEVLVPTVVFDQKLYAQFKKTRANGRNSYNQLVEHDEKLWDAIIAKNLTTKDFHLYEDGREQTVQRVKLEPPSFRLVQDNLGKHPEILGTGGGLWAYPDLPKTDPTVWLAWPQYVIAYAPAESPKGSCHQIEVKVVRPNLTVWNRGEYCNTPHPANDPLEGTELGSKMEKAAASKTANGIDVRLNVAAFADSAESGRVYVTARFPWQSLWHEFRGGILYANIGSLVMIYRKDGMLAARYSDFACCDYGNKKDSAKDAASASEEPLENPGRQLPERYESQFALPPGEYRICAVISDGVHFGVQEAPLTVASYDPSKLQINGLALSRRIRKVPADSVADQVAGNYAPLVSKGVEFTPSVTTEFFHDEMVFAYFEIIEPPAAGQPSGKVQANMRIVESGSGALADTFEPVDTAAYRNGNTSVIAVARGVRLNHLSPGAYRLEVRATNAEGKSTAWRSANFTVIDAPPLQLGGAADPATK